MEMNIDALVEKRLKVMEAEARTEIVRSIMFILTNLHKTGIDDLTCVALSEKLQLVFAEIKNEFEEVK
ncbi:MAG: hypothetical protein PHT07_24385 [Paludibacter sp.]|nr:hypothetical protein [Paludibacter sp.]